MASLAQLVLGKCIEAPVAELLVFEADWAVFRGCVQGDLAYSDTKAERRRELLSIREPHEVRFSRADVR